MPKLRRETGRGFAVTELAGVSLNNSLSETTLFSQVIEAGKMGTVKELGFEFFCMLTTPALSLPSLTIRLKFGGNTLTVANSLGIAASQSNEPFIVRGKIVNKASNSQVAYACIEQGAASLPLVLGVASSFKGAKWSVDTSQDQTLSLTGQFSLLSGGTTLTLENATIDLS